LNRRRRALARIAPGPDSNARRPHHQKRFASPRTASVIPVDRAPVIAPAGRGQRRSRRAFAAVLAMLYLMLFTVLAIGFYAATTISLQIAGNDRTTSEAQAAAESGMQFVKYQLSRIEIPAVSGPAARDGDELTTIARLLGNQLDGTANMRDHAVAVIDHAIILPAADDFIALDATGHARFRALITPIGSSLMVKVIGFGRSVSIGRAVRMEFQRTPSRDSGDRLVAAPGTYEEAPP
jgi:hypothetical protein